MQIIRRLLARGKVPVGQGDIASQDWSATHRHKNGGLYRELMRGVLEANHEPMVVYDDKDGTVWIRPVAEFDDGRFTPTG